MENTFSFKKYLASESQDTLEYNRVVTVEDDLKPKNVMSKS